MPPPSGSQTLHLTTHHLTEQPGGQAVLRMQAADGLVSTILTSYGRVRATTALDRRQLTPTM
jgi:hypothetical protein